jgi:long-chain acyl-CoA synthetase
MSRRTLYQMFEETARQHGEQAAVGFRVGKAADLTYWTYNELAQKVKQFRRGLDAIGLRKGDRIAILAENRVEWAVVDLAAQALGLVNVAPYASLPTAQVAFIVRDSGAKMLVLSDAKQLKKLREFRAECTELQFVVAMDGAAEALKADDVLAFAEVTERGESAGRDEATLDRIAREVDPESPAMFIYTSGTTGEPKGAMLSHMAMLQTPDAVMDEPIAAVGPGDQFLSFLPLSHITERVGGHYLPLRAGACIVYSQGLSSIGEEITTTVRPHVMLCVPRIFENIYDKFKDSLVKMEPDMRGKVEWGLKIGTQAAERRSEGKGLGLVLGIQYALASKLILPKIREKVTGGRIRFFVSGGAPLDRETATFFLAIGIQILEGYGLSETNIITINRPGKQRIGTVGKLLLNAEIKIAGDGEILMRGQGRMAGYYNRQEATVEAIDTDGWFRTGDIGELSSDGYLKITDRKKDLIVLTNGKKVAPQPIEATLKQSAYIGEAVLFGDKQPTISALLVPNFGRLLEWAKSQDLPTGDIAVLVASPEVQKLLKAEVDRETRGLADYEKIKRFRVLDKPFGIESGELTPTLKVKRKFVAQKYAETLAGMIRT